MSDRRYIMSYLQKNTRSFNVCLNVNRIGLLWFYSLLRFRDNGTTSLTKTPPASLSPLAHPGIRILRPLRIFVRHASGRDVSLRRILPIRAHRVLTLVQEVLLRRGHLVPLSRLCNQIRNAVGVAPYQPATRSPPSRHRNESK